MARATEDKVLHVVSDVLGIPTEELNDDSSPDTIAGWDSQSHISLILSLEAEFGVSLSPEDAMEMLSVKLIRIILAERGVSDTR